MRKSNPFFCFVCVVNLLFGDAAAQSTFQYDLNGNVTNVVATIPGPPTISVDPASQNVFYGQNASLSVDASGAGPLSYQWYQNGALIQGATNSTLFSSDVTNSGVSYSVVVSNRFGSITSAVPAVVVLGETWVGNSGGDWFNPLNWYPPRVPDGSENITVPFGSGTINLTSPVTITGTLNWSDGTMVGTLMVASNGVMNITGNIAVYGKWIYHGAINATDLSLAGGTITMDSGGTFNNSGNPVIVTGILTNSTLLLSAASGSFIFNGGGLIGGTVRMSDGTSLIVAGNGTLNGVTMSGTLDVGNTYNGASLTVTNGLVLNGTMLVGNPTNLNNGSVSFLGSQSLSGTGSVLFGDATYNCTSGAHPPANGLGLVTGGTTLTIGPGITIHGQDGTVGAFQQCGAPSPANAGVINEGTIVADVSGGTILITAQPLINQGAMAASNGGQLNAQDLTGNLGLVSLIAGSTLTLGGAYTNNLALSLTTNAVLNLEGNWANTGSINATNATVNFGGNFTLANLGVLNNVGSTVELTGILNGGGGTLSLNAAGGSWLMNGGTLLNTVLNGSGGAKLIANNNANNTLNGVTMGGTLDVGNTYNVASLLVTNGLVLNGTMLVGNPTNLNSGSVSFLGSQTLSGTGSVVFGAATYNCTSGADPPANGLGLVTGGTTLTIGPGITVHGQNGTVGAFQQCGAPSPANAGVINEGTIVADVSGGTILITAQPLSNQGLLGAAGGGQLVADDLVGDLGMVSLIASSTLTLNGTYTNNLTLGLTTNAVLNLEGNWANTGSINATNATVNFGGNFTLANLGVFNNVGGAVELTGILNGGGGTLSLNAAGGSWLMNGGTLLNTILNGSGGAKLIANNNANNTLNGVTMSGTLDVGNTYNGASLTVTNGLMLNGTMLVGNPTNLNSGSVSFLGSQTLSGTGSVVFGAATYNCTSGAHPPANGLGLVTGGTTLTIGPGITVHGQNGTVGAFQQCGAPSPANAGVINEGTIAADMGGGTILITAQPFYNEGILAATVATVSLSGSDNLMGGNLEFGLSGPNSFGKISFSGNAPLAGTIGAILLNGFVPALSNSFPVLSYGSESGIFTTVNLPAGFVWQTNYGPTTFTLAVSAPSPVLQAVANSSSPFLFQFTAPTNAHYTVLASTNIASPLSNWPSLATPSLLSNSLYQFTDTQSVNLPSRFYLLRSP